MDFVTVAIDNEGFNYAWEAVAAFAGEGLTRVEAAELVIDAIDSDNGYAEKTLDDNRGFAQLNYYGDTGYAVMGSNYGSKFIAWLEWYRKSTTVTFTIQETFTRTATYEVPDNVAADAAGKYDRDSARQYLEAQGYTPVGDYINQDEHITDMEVGDTQ